MTLPWESVKLEPVDHTLDEGEVCNLTPWTPELYSLSGFSFLFHEWGPALLFSARNNRGDCVLCGLI